jgi:hypothetical protein
MTDFERDMDGAGISMWCGSVIERVTELEAIQRLNREAVKLRDGWNGKYIPGVHIHPSYVDASVKELEWADKSGVKLVGELVPYYNGWEDYYDSGLNEIYKAIDRLNMVVSLHTQSDDTIDQALANFPNITFVCAHPRDHKDYDRHIKRMQMYDNCYIDISGTGLFRWGMLKTLVDKVGSERILFGTDYPICNPKMYVQAVDYEKISSQAKENIYYNNAVRILGLNRN